MILPQIVIDTNILVAGLRYQDGYALRLLELVGTGRFEINLSVPLVLEYEAIINRELPNLQVSQQVVDAVINYLCRGSPPSHLLFVAPFLA